jgi:hypothetical protein
MTVDIARIKRWREARRFLDEGYEGKTEPPLKMKKAG